MIPTSLPLLILFGTSCVLWGYVIGRRYRRPYIEESFDTPQTISEDHIQAYERILNINRISLPGK